MLLFSGVCFFYLNIIDLQKHSLVVLLLKLFVIKIVDIGFRNEDTLVQINSLSTFKLLNLLSDHHEDVDKDCR